MTRAAIALMVMCVLSACGEPPLPGPPPDLNPKAPPAPIHPAFAGAWTGPLNLTVDGRSLARVDHTMLISVNADAAMITGLCVGGSGEVTVYGTNDTLLWEGVVRCPVINTDTCQAGVTYTSGIFSLFPGSKTLSVTLEGVLAGCGERTGLISLFSASQ